MKSLNICMWKYWLIQYLKQHNFPPHKKVCERSSTKKQKKQPKNKKQKNKQKQKQKQKKKEKQRKIWIKCQIWAENQRKSLNFDSTKLEKKRENQLKRGDVTPLYKDFRKKLLKFHTFSTVFLYWYYIVYRYSIIQIKSNQIKYHW